MCGLLLRFCQSAGTGVRPRHYRKVRGGRLVLEGIEVWWSNDLAPQLDEWRTHRAALASAIEGDAWTTVASSGRLP